MRMNEPRFICRECGYEADAYECEAIIKLPIFHCPKCCLCSSWEEFEDDDMSRPEDVHPHRPGRLGGGA